MIGVYTSWGGGKMKTQTYVLERSQRGTRKETETYAPLVSPASELKESHI